MYSPREQVWDDPLNHDLMPYDRAFEPVVGRQSPSRFAHKKGRSPISAVLAKNMAGRLVKLS